MGAKRPSRSAEILKSIVVLILLIIAVRLFIFKFVEIDDDSMANTLLPGDVVGVNVLSYAYSNPLPGDIVLLKHPLIMEESLIRRVAAVEGQIVEIRDKKLFVNDKPVEDTKGIRFVDYRIFPSAISARDNYGPIQVPSGTVFILCDDRDMYPDSRIWGFINVSEIIGKTSLIVYSWKPDPNAPQIENSYLTYFVRAAFYYTTHIFSQPDWERCGISIS